MSLNLDIIKVLTVLSESSWTNFDDIERQTGISSNRLALILLFGAKKYHIFICDYGDWTINEKYRPKDMEKFLYSDLSLEPFSLDDLEFYFLIDHFSDSLISNKIYSKLRKTTRKNLPPLTKVKERSSPEIEKPTPTPKPDSAQIQAPAPKPDPVQTQTPAQETKLVITTSHRQRKEPSELFSKNKPKSLSAFYFQKISGHKKAHRSTYHQPTMQQLSAQANHGAYRGERINNPAIETSRELDRSRRDIEKFKTEPGFNELDRGAMK